MRTGFGLADSAERVTAGQTGRAGLDVVGELDDAMSALTADSFQAPRTASEALGATYFLLVCREI